MRRLLSLSAPMAAAAGGYALLVRGALTLDLGVGRRARPLGPIARTIAAPPEVVFDVIAGPYLGRTPRAMHDQLRVWERSDSMVLAEHLTTTGRLTTATLETVTFERPHRISFRLVRGPVPHVAESYDLRETPYGTAFVYSGELGTDLWRLGQWGNGGQTASPRPGKTPSRTRSTRSRPKPNAAPHHDFPEPARGPPSTPSNQHI